MFIVILQFIVFVYGLIQICFFVGYPFPLFTTILFLLFDCIYICVYIWDVNYNVLYDVLYIQLHHLFVFYCISLIRFINIKSVLCFCHGNRTRVLFLSLYSNIHFCESEEYNPQIVFVSYSDKIQAYNYWWISFTSIYSHRFYLFWFFRSHMKKRTKCSIISYLTSFFIYII